MGKIQKTMAQHRKGRPRLAVGRQAPSCRLQAERLTRGISQEALARELWKRGVVVTGRHIGMLESGDSGPSDAVLLALAAYFGTTAAELASWLPAAARAPRVAA